MRSTWDEVAEIDNIRALLSDSSVRPDRVTLYNRPSSHMVSVMKTRALLLIVALLALPAMASAACYADYKAKQDSPLRLHYGVVKVSDGACPPQGRVSADIAQRISRDGWQLLNVVSTFDDAGLDQRRASAGEFFLRY